MRLALSFVLACCACFSLACEALAQNNGKFVGRVVTRWENDGRQMTVMEPFQFVDGHDRRWSVPRGTSVDGASIPQVFWSLIGGPFEGKYRNASVIHDYYCQVRNRRWQDVHQAFYDAMLASGVDQGKALVMYKAVESFGPRWTEPGIPRCLKPDGTVGKCTGNNRESAIVENEPPAVTWPATDKPELRQFLSEVGSVADPEDLEKLRRAIEK
jgi:hypothetical protein